MGASDVVVVDVSEPSDNLLWELDLLSRTNARCVPVGGVDQLAALPDATSSAATGVRKWLEGRRVVGYATSELPAFSAALRTMLDER